MAPVLQQVLSVSMSRSTGEPIRVAVIGAGKMARLHLQALLRVRPQRSDEQLQDARLEEPADDRCEHERADRDEGATAQLGEVIDEGHHRPLAIGRRRRDGGAERPSVSHGAWRAER